MIDIEHENAVKIKEWFSRNKQDYNFSENTLFDIYKELSYYGRVVESDNLKDRLHAYKMQISFIRKNILGLVYKENSGVRGLKEGYVYAVHNPAWKDYVKIGCSIDVYDRLKSYQTSSPLRDYQLVGYVFSDNKLSLEKEIHEKFERNGEWVKTDPTKIKSFLKQHENFQIDKILEFSISEICKIIGSSNDVKESITDKVRVKTFLKMLKNKLPKEYNFLSDIDINAKNSIHKFQSVWKISNLDFKVKVLDNRVVLI